MQRIIRKVVRRQQIFAQTNQDFESTKRLSNFTTYAGLVIEVGEWYVYKEI